MLPQSETGLRAEFYEGVTAVIRTARARVYRAANSEMVEAYWNVRLLIAEEEQHRKVRAEYAAFLNTRTRRAGGTGRSRRERRRSDR
jgi:hypothetical protein